MICYYWYFVNKGLRFQSFARNLCHDALMFSLNRNSIAILDINGIDYGCIISGISKIKAINLIKKC